MLAYLDRSLTNQSEKVDQSMTKRGTYGLLMQIANCCIMVEGIVPHFVASSDGFLDECVPLMGKR